MEGRVNAFHVFQILWDSLRYVVPEDYLSNSFKHFDNPQLCRSPSSLVQL